jgi:hypothetical protein
MKVVPDHDFRTAPQPKVIVIPAMDESGAPQEMYDWIRGTSKEADVTMSVCTGASVLAKTGLLNGESTTTHHAGYFGLAANYPQVHLVRGARFVEQGNLATAGGVSSGIDLAIRVVERYVGREPTDQLIDMIEYQGRGWQNADSNETFANARVDGPEPDLRGLFYGHGSIHQRELQGQDLLLLHGRSQKPFRKTYRCFRPIPRGRCGCRVQIEHLNGNLTFTNRRRDCSRRSPWRRVQFLPAFFVSCNTQREKPEQSEMKSRRLKPPSSPKRTPCGNDLVSAEEIQLQ